MRPRLDNRKANEPDTVDSGIRITCAYHIQLQLAPTAGSVVEVNDEASPARIVYSEKESKDMEHHLISNDM